MDHIDIIKLLNAFRQNNSMLWVENGHIKLLVSDGFKNQGLKDTITRFKPEIVDCLVSNKIFSQDDFLKTTIFKTIGDRQILSYSQERLWFIEQYEEGTNAYHLPEVYEFDSSVNIDAVRYALQQIVSRHEVLRSTIEQDPALNQGIQVVHQEPLAIEDISLESGDDYHTLLKTEINRPFDLSKEYPIRARFYYIPSADASEQKTILLINMHHIASDGWSTDLFEQELSACYEAYVKGDSEFKLPALEIQYKDYALWQRSYLSGELLDKQLSYWTEKLAGYQTLEFPTDYARPGKIDYRGAQQEFILNKALSTKLKALAQTHGLTLNTVLLSAMSILLGKYTGQDDIIIGSLIANRHHRQTEDLIGFFVNTQANRMFLSPNQSFEELLLKVHQEQIDAQLHQDLPFEKLVDALNVERDTSRHPVFQILFGVQSFGTEKNYLKTFQLKNSHAVSQFDATVFIDDSTEALSGQISYATSLFRKERMEKFARHYTYLLEQLSAAPEKAYANFGLLDAEEYQQVIHDWNATEQAYPKDKTIHRLFEEQVERTADHIALVFEGQALSYRQLNEKSNQLAHQIREEYQRRTNKELRPDTLIALCLDRSLEMVIGILAVLKAGGAYVPIDPNYPQERIDWMLEDTGTMMILSLRSQEEQLNHKLPAEQVMYIDLAEEFYKKEECKNNLLVISHPEDLAYVLYTSGTTGKPKGVMIEHNSLINFSEGMNKAVPLLEQGQFLAITSFTFDISILEFLWTLTKGIKVTLKPTSTPVNRFSPHAPSWNMTLDFSLFYFASQEDRHQDKYRFLKESAVYADKNKYAAIWLPERHFHEFGGIFPNPSVLAAGLATMTTQLEIRSGSVVLPLHDSIRVAEEWSVVDNLSNGRVALSIASGWHVNDFVLKPENYAKRQEIMYGKIEELKALWKGRAIKRNNGLNQEVEIKIYPKPVNPDLNIYITSGGSPETFISAGKTGANILTHLLGQEIKDLEQNIKLYKQSLRESGFSADDAKIVLMLHTYIGTDLEEVKQKVKEPFKSYLKSSVSLIQSLSKDANISSADDAGMNELLELGFERYWQTAALFGTADSCEHILSSVYAIGVTEIACLVDFGMEDTVVLEGLNHLTTLKNKFAKGRIIDHIKQDQITAMQITPSYLEVLLEDENSAGFIQSLQHILVGGEKFPESLLKKLTELNIPNIYNMYGPTETTIWSTYQKVRQDTTLSIGKPIANTQVYVLDRDKHPVPIGVAGELFIGGAGLSRGYLNRPELTAERFIDNPFATETDKAKGYTRLYKTGDLVKWLPDGQLEYLGRNDDQVKIRGFRIELGEIEQALLQVPGIQQACVLPKERTTDHGSSKYLAAYYIPNHREKPLTEAFILEQISRVLPEYMLPSALVAMDAFPLTINGKLNKRGFPDPSFSVPADTYVAPGNDQEAELCRIWQELLGLDQVGITDNFFKIGGNSILAIQASHRMSQALGYDIKVADLFKFNEIKELLQHTAVTEDDQVEWSLG